jgi:hypothetical protein
MQRLPLLDPTKTGRQAEDLENKLSHSIVGRLKRLRIDRRGLQG